MTMPPEERVGVQRQCERLLRGLSEWLRTNKLGACYSQAWAEMPEERSTEKKGRAGTGARGPA